ncbi:MAG: hypothetical protein HYT80_06215 [Euryarchaeota archaeon]|nr:hypothetical protein [Euryarchaeota archaeon]
MKVHVSELIGAAVPATRRTQASRLRAWALVALSVLVAVAATEPGPHGGRGEDPRDATSSAPLSVSAVSLPAQTTPLVGPTPTTTPGLPTTSPVGDGLLGGSNPPFPLVDLAWLLWLVYTAIMFKAIPQGVLRVGAAVVGSLVLFLPLGGFQFGVLLLAQLGVIIVVVTQWSR